MPQELNQFIPLITPFITGVVGFVAGWHLNESKRNRDAKFKFRGTVNSTFSRIRAAQFIFVGYNETKGALRDAVSEYAVFLEGAKRERLEKLWDEYSELTQDDLLGGYAQAVSKQVFEGHYEEPQDVLAYYSAEFLKI